MERLGAEAAAAGAEVATRITEELAGKVPEEELAALRKLVKDQRLQAAEQADRARLMEKSARSLSTSPEKTGELIAVRSRAAQAISTLVLERLEEAVGHGAEGRKIALK